MKKILVTIKTSDEIKHKIINETDNVEIHFIDKNDLNKDIIKQYNAIIGNVNPELLENSNIEWLHLETAGIDKYTKIPDKIQLTNSKGAYSEAIAEYILGSILIMYKRFDQYIKNQKYHSWEYLGEIKQLKNSNICVIGLGDIGNTFALKAHLLGANVFGVKKTIYNKPEYIQKIYTTDNLEEILGKSDIVVLILPSTKDTRNLFDYKLLSKIKKDSLLINVGRGDTVVTEDLIKLLEEKHFGGVVLDVCNPEPLPINSKLWQFDNVLITPHISGNYSMEYSYNKVIDIAIENINNFSNSKQLINIVNKGEDY